MAVFLVKHLPISGTRWRDKHEITHRLTSQIK